MIDRAAILRAYESFVDSEGIFIKTLDQIIKATVYYEGQVTDFLTPDHVYVFRKIIEMHTDLSCTSFGVFPEAERSKLIILPAFSETIDMNDHISLIEIIYNQKFNQLGHKDALGALMALGVKRSKIGDIIVFDGGFQVAIDKSLQDYFMSSVDKIGRAGVRVALKAFEEAKAAAHDSKDVTGTVKSLRLDSFIALAYNLSRQEAQNLVEGDQVKVNYMVTAKTDYSPKRGDLISVRGYGRFTVQDILGTTKKDRIRVSISIMAR